jgi:TonB family protein
MRSLSTILLVLAFAAACGSNRPTADIEAARAAGDKAEAANAGRYAAPSMAAAESAQSALDAELAAQEAKWMKSYDRTRELAAAARSAGEKAAADAVAGRERAEASARAAAAKAEAARATQASAVRVGGDVRPPVKIKDVAPVYPPVAKSARVGGTVQVELTVDPNGKVADARVLKSVPLLDHAALEAVKQWEYTPTRVKGVAVPVLVNVGINFQP